MDCQRPVTKITYNQSNIAINPAPGKGKKMKATNDSARSLRSTGILLLLGVIIFSAGTIVAEPFEQETAAGLYQAIAQNGSSFLVVNLLVGLGFILVVLAFWLLISNLSTTHRRKANTGFILLIIATALWLLEIIARLTLTSSKANEVAAGSPIPTTFPANVGIGLEPLFIAFLITTLVGLAILLWQLGRAGLLSQRWSSIGAGMTVATGGIAAFTYPWVGGIERALFYPFVLVLLPLAISLLVRSRR